MGADNDQQMSSNGSLRVRPRSRATSFVSVSNELAQSTPAPSSREEDARARLTRLSSADLRRRDAAESLSRSTSSAGLAESRGASPTGSPTKRARLSLEGDEGQSRGRHRQRQPSSQPATISEDPSASLLLANEEAAVPVLKKQKSWTDLYRQIALGEQPVEEAKVEPLPLASGSKVEAGTQTETAAVKLAASQPERTSWFSWSRSASATSNLADLAEPAASTQPVAPSEALTDAPVQASEAAPLALPRAASKPPSRRASFDQSTSIAASPTASSLRTLIAGRGPRGTSKTRIPKQIEPATREEGVQTEAESVTAAQTVADPSVQLPKAEPSKVDSPQLAAPPLAASVSRSSWWSRAPATPTLPDVVTSVEPARRSTESVREEKKATEPAVLPPKVPEKAVEGSPQPASGWRSWWGRGEPSTAELTAQPPAEAAPEPVLSVPPINPIVDTLPDSRSTWSKYFSGKSVARAAVKGDMEVMEVDFPAPPATPPISPTLLPKDKSSKPSSVRSLPLNGPEPVKDKPSSKPLTASKKASKAALKPNAPNLVLPTFKDSFERPPRSLPPRQGAIAKALSVVNAYLGSTPAPSSSSSGSPDFSDRLPKTFAVMGRSNHLERIRRVVVVGVHGWFPAAIVQSLVGRPTGTSPRFTSMMSASIREYLKERGVFLADDAITSIPLEGEGKIGDRVERLYGVLTARTDWVEALQTVDALFVATHSQGSIVSTQLVDRLITEGYLRGTAKITMLCMASVSHGPFPYIGQSWSFQPYFQYVEGEAARELFVLQDAESAPSRSYRESMQRILDAGVKIVLVASCDDQVVPLSSGLFHSLSHPGILRAVFVDSQAFAASDFIVNLVVFAVRLRNAGLSDHDLLPQLSEALAGSLTGVGHSRIYDEKMVYDLAVRYAFETTSTLSMPTTSTSLAPIPAQYDAFDPRVRRTNPHFLPWTVRGVIEEHRIRSLFADELSELRDAFEDWHPTSKALKDVRYQLEPLRTIPRRTASVDAVSKTAKL